MNRTFRDDTDPNRREQLKANMNIINEYAVKGIELLYNKFSNCHDKQILCDQIYEFVNSFAMDIGEKKKEQFIAEEEAAELKMFSELGVQRHFIRAKENEQEEDS